MTSKLTLRMDAVLVKQAKNAALRRGKSVSGMVAEFFDSLNGRAGRQPDLPPVTRSLVGVLKGHHVSEADHKRHVREKYL